MTNQEKARFLHDHEDTTLPLREGDETWGVVTRFHMTERQRKHYGEVSFYAVHDQYGFYKGPQEGTVPTVKRGPFHTKGKAEQVAKMLDGKAAGPAHLVVRLTQDDQ